MFFEHFRLKITLEDPQHFLHRGRGEGLVVLDKFRNKMFRRGNFISLKSFRSFSLSLNISCSKALNEFSLKHPEAFWGEAAKAVSWSKPYTKVRGDIH